MRVLKEKRSERTARERVTRELKHSTRTPTYHKRADKIWTRLSVSDRNGVAGDPSTACSDLITVVECAVVVGT